MAAAFWTNPSVLTFSRQRDPIEAITIEARKVVFNALELGWDGPPFDPFRLAELLSIETRPTSEVFEARTVPIEGHRYRIEFNPDRPRRRMRYSVFHEIAHTLFSDCAEMIRHRGKHNASRPDDWQLETLCNIAAAEFLLPTGALRHPSDLQPSVDSILKLRQEYEASAEAALLRIQRLTSEPAVAFSCHFDQPAGRYLVEYASPTPSITWTLPTGSVLPVRTVVAECTAIGYTAKGKEHWPRLGEVWIECVGIAAFPNETLPRVIGFVRPPEAQTIKSSQIIYVRGDATQTRGEDRKLLLQVVNDGAFTWGGHGFAGAVRRRWPAAQRAYTEQVTSDRSMLKLVDVYVGGQYGSEGKGHIISYVAREYQVLLRVGGPNAGHKVFMEDGAVTHHQLPSGTLRTDAKVLIGPGAVLNIDLLQKEIAQCKVSANRLGIDPQAMIIDQADIANEGALKKAIGSTGQGVGFATARKIRERGARVKLSADYKELKPYIKDVWEELEKAYSAGWRVLLEGTQGTGLSIHHGIYPYVTSRDTTVAGCLSEAGIPPSRVRKVVMVCRTYPIRVQSPTGGTSGPMSKEISWAEVSKRSGIPLAKLKKTEKTSTTNRDRRVSEFDWALLRKAAALNGPTDVALTFADYLHKANEDARRFEQLDKDDIQFIEQVERVAAAPVSLISTRFDFRSIIDRRAW